LSRISGAFVDRIHPRIAIAAIEAALTVALAYQAAQLFWIAVAPLAPFVPAMPVERISEAQIAGLTRSNPFLARQPVVPQAETGGGQFVLYGVRSGGKDGGSAIIAASGSPQSLYAVGEDVAPGVKLKSVASGYAVLAQGTRNFRLSLPYDQTASGTMVPSYLSTPARPPAPARTVSIDPKKFLAESGLRPRTENGQITGYTLLPRGQGEMLKQAGLAAGDVLIALNGSRITPERYSELEQELVAGPEVQLTVQRGSETKTITLATGR
jgi:general secretion pathway protein C